MASALTIQGASPLIGSPITYRLRAATINGSCAFHRVKLTVRAALDGDTDYTNLTLSSPAESGEYLTFDISSALRAVADRYEYSPTPPASYPRIRYLLSACDEYMQNGEVHDNVGVTELAEPQYVLMGAYSDMERILSGGSKRAQHFSRKPFSSPEVVPIGEAMVCPQSFATPVTSGLATNGPTSQVVNITTPGLQVVNGRSVFAVPKKADHYIFRFVNGLGCLESVAVLSLRTTEMNVTSETFIRSVQETFSNFSRSAITKKNDYETWKLSSGPLDINWQAWFLHEFLMTPQAWVKVNDNWIACHIIPDETVTGINRTDGSICEVQFSVQLDINGSPLAALAI